MKRLLIHSVMFALILSLFIPAPADANAAIGPGCETFYYQEDAQYAYERTRDDYPTLFDQFATNTDPDGNGVACDDLQTAPTMHPLQISGRGNFDSGRSSFGTFRLVTYSLFVSADIAGVDLTSAACPDLLSDDVLNSLIVPEGERVRPALLGPDVEVVEGVGPTKVSALVWLPLDDPQNPLLLNEWMISQGIGSFDASTTPEPYSAQLQDAEKLAKANKLGIWGDCQAPEALSTDVSNTYRSMVQASGNGDQVVPFSITTPGTYQLTLNAGGGNVVVFFVDVHDHAGNQIYEFSISSAESGNFSSAGFLPAGEYYVQVKAVGSWKITVDPMP